MSADDATETGPDELGAVLEALVSDHQPTPTQTDWPPTPGSPFDAALAIFHAAATGDDAANDAELSRLHEQRNDEYRAAINDTISGDPQ